MIKSSTLNEDEFTKRKGISTFANDLETTSRRILDIDGGRSVITAAAASIDILYIDARLAAPLALPFKVIVDGVKVVYDEIEPSPVAEGFESDVGDCDKCEEIVESFSHGPTSADSVDICIELSAKNLFR
jgi:hypothetical protein